MPIPALNETDCSPLAFMKRRSKKSGTVLADLIEAIGGLNYWRSCLNWSLR